MKTLHHYRKIPVLNLTFIIGTLVMCVGYWWVSPSTLKAGEFYESRGKYSSAIYYYEKTAGHKNLNKKELIKVYEKLCELYQIKNMPIEYLKTVKRLSETIGPRFWKVPDEVLTTDLFGNSKGFFKNIDPSETINFPELHELRKLLLKENN